MYNVRPAWVEVNLSNSINNLNEVRRIVGQDTKICAVVKANSYGMGTVKMAKTYLENGADMLAVAVLSEAIEIRDEVKDCSILVLGYTPESQYKEALENDISITIYNYDHGAQLSKIAKEINKIGKVHIKVDTGMNRIGFKPTEDNAVKVLDISKLDNIVIEGVYTHFARADEINKEETIKQKNKYNNFISMLEKYELTDFIKHTANSAAIIDMPECKYDMVRPGLMLAGFYPSKEVKKENANLKVAITLKSKIANIKTITKDEGVGYGHKFVAKKNTVVGTLPIGYADGFLRLLSKYMSVVYKGVKCPILGNICMDQCMIDLTNVQDPQLDDVVIIYGDGTDLAYTAEDAGDLIGTIHEEMITNLSKRLPRVYVD